MAWVRSKTSQLRYLLRSESSPTGCTIIPQRPLMSTNYDIGIGSICFHWFIHWLSYVVNWSKALWLSHDYGVCKALRSFCKVFCAAKQGKGALNQLPPCGDCFSRTSLQSCPHIPLQVGHRWSSKCWGGRQLFHQMDVQRTSPCSS